MNFFKNRPLALCCAAFIIIYFVSAYIPPFIKLILGIIAVLTVFVFFIFVRRCYIVPFIALFCVCALIFGYFYYDVHATISDKYIDESHTVEFEITDITYQSDKISYLDGLIISEDDEFNCHFTLYGGAELEVGDTVKASVEFFEVVNTDDFNAVRYYKSKDIWIEAEAESYEVLGNNRNLFRQAVSAIQGYCSSSFERYTDEETSALMNALTIGDKSDISDSVKRDFTRAGLNHMLAISGMHLSIIMGSILMISELFSLNRRLRSLFVCVICLCFIFIAGASASILRAGAMFIIMSAADLFKRKSDSLTNLFFAVFVIFLFSPSAVFDVGLILSFTSTLGIIVVVGYYLKKIKTNVGVLRKIGTSVLVSVLTTLAAMSFSFIVLLAYFTEISTVSIISNLVISPILTVILIIAPIFLIVSVIPFIGAFIGGILNLLSGILIYIVSLIARIPNAYVSLKYPFVVYTFIAILVGVIIAVIIRKRYTYLMPYICWFTAFTVCLMAFNIGYGNNCDVVFYSEKGSDAILMRNFGGTVYLDLGKGSNSAQERAFKIMSNELYASELEYWVVGSYSNNIIYSFASVSREIRIHNICIPTPVTLLDKTTAEEIEHYAVLDNVEVIYYDYYEPFSLNGTELTLYSPITFEDSGVLIPSAQIDFGEKSVSYYGMGHFNYALPHGECDILYLGEMGTTRKQTKSAGVECETLITSFKNTVAAEGIYSDKIVLDDDSHFVKMRVN